MATETYQGKPCPYGHTGLRWKSNRKCIGCSKMYNDSTKEYRKEYYKKWWENKKELRVEINKKWRLENPDRATMLSRIQAHKRRAWKKGQKVTVEEIDNLFALQQKSCPICRDQLTDYQVDHIIPLSKGGLHHIDNIQLLCPTCNRSKSNKDPVEHMQSLGYLF